MSESEKIKLLIEALEAIRLETIDPYFEIRKSPPTTKEKLTSWAKIQSIVAKTIRQLKNE